MSDLTDDDIQRIWDECFRATPPRVRPPVCVFARAVIAASQEGRTALPANLPSPLPGPSRAFVPYDGLTAEFIDEVCRFAGDAEGLSQAISAALETCEACIVPAPPTALEAQQKGAMPPALVERGIERRSHFEAHLGNCYRIAYTNMLVPDRRIKDRRRA